HFCSVRRDGGERSDGSVMSKRVLIRAVPIHRPDFLRAGAIRNEHDTASNQAFYAEDGKNIGGVLVSYLGSTFLVQRACIDFAERLRALHVVRLACVEQPAEEHELAVLFGSIADADVVGGNRRLAPIGKLHAVDAPSFRSGRPALQIRRLLRQLQWIHRLRDEINRAGSFDILLHSLIEDGHELGRAATAAKIGNGDIRLLTGLTDSSADGRLLRRNPRGRGKQQRSERKNFLHRRSKVNSAGAVLSVY